MKRIAITGGIACGKSLLARYLSQMGVRIIDADDVVHELEASGGAAVAPIVARFGESVRAPDGGIDRQQLANIVFMGGHPDQSTARADLEAILFPMVRKRIQEFIDGPHPSSLFPLSIIPLLFESHWESDYDIIVSLVSEHEVQIRRMAETRGMSREQAEARIAAQMPVTEKASRADYVIENNSTPQALHAEAVRLVEWLQSKIQG